MESDGKRPGDGLRVLAVWLDNLAIRAPRDVAPKCEEAAATLRDMAAAQDEMLAALRGLLGHAGRDPEANDDVIAAYDAARAAIARAEAAQ